MDRETPRARKRPSRSWPRVAAGIFLFLLLGASAARAQELEADVFVARAVVAYQEKRYEEALDALRQALAVAPDHVDALYYQGVVLIALDRLKEAAVSLEQARLRAPSDDAIQLQLGIAHLGLKEDQAAREILEPLFARSPQIDGLGYYVGLLRYRAADYPRAVEAFRQGVTTDPKLQQLSQFYVGLALASAGARELAAREIEQAIRILPTSPLVGPAERVREAVAAGRAQPERPLHIEVRIGGFYDDNVPVNPAISDDPTVRQLRTRKPESPGELAALRLDYALVRRPNFELGLTYSFFANINNDLHDFDLVDNLGAASATYRGTVGSLPYSLYLQYSYDYLTLGGDEYLRRQILTPAATLIEGAHNLTTGQMRFEYDDYATDQSVVSDERRTGPSFMVGVIHFFRSAGDRHFLKVGYQWDMANPEGRNFRYKGNRLLAGAQVTLPWGGARLRYDFDVHFLRYDELNSVLPATAPLTVKRRDTEYTHLVNLSIPLPWNLTLSFDYQRTNDDSNIAVFTYTRNVVSTSLSWSY